MNRIIWKWLGVGSFVVAMLLIVFGLVTRPTSAETFIAPTDDVYVDINNPNTNFNGQGLDLGYSNFPGFSSTQEAYLRFDLSGVSAVTGRSILHVTITSNGWGAGSTLDVSLYGISGDGWNETTVTFNNPPSGTPTLLQTIQVPGGTTGKIGFGNSSADNPVGTYIENERIGDGVASFLIRLTSGSNLGFAGTSTLEDREDSQTPGIIDEPYLNMLTPTAISLRTFNVQSPIGKSLPLVVVGLLLLSGLSLFAFRNQKN